MPFDIFAPRQPNYFDTEEIEPYRPRWDLLQPPARQSVVQPPEYEDDEVNPALERLAQRQGTISGGIAAALIGPKLRARERNEQKRRNLLDRIAIMKAEAELKQAQRPERQHGQFIDTMSNGRRVKRWVPEGDTGEYESPPPVDRTKTEAEMTPEEHEAYLDRKARIEAKYRKPDKPDKPDKPSYHYSSDTVMVNGKPTRIQRVYRDGRLEREEKVGEAPPPAGVQTAREKRDQSGDELYQAALTKFEEKVRLQHKRGDPAKNEEKIQQRLAGWKAGVGKMLKSKNRPPGAVKVRFNDSGQVQWLDAEGNVLK